MLSQVFAALRIYITNPDDQGDRVIRWMQPKKGFINVRYEVIGVCSLECNYHLSGFTKVDAA